MKVLAGGQIWGYANRVEDVDSVVFVRSLCYHSDVGKVAHVAITNVYLDTSRSFIDVEHVPITTRALESCLTQFLGMFASDFFSPEGLDAWNISFASGEAGVYDIPLNEITAIIDQTYGESE